MEKQVVDVPRLIAWLEARNTELKEFGINDEIYQPLTIDLVTLIRTAKAHQPSYAHATGGKAVWLWYEHNNKYLTLTADIQ